MKVVALKVVALGAVMTAAVVLAPAVMAEDGVVVTDRDRLFTNYTREAATVGHGVLRFELRGFHSEDVSNPDLDVRGFPIEGIERKENDTITETSGNIIDMLGSFGIGDNAEVGFDIPVILQEFQRETRGGVDKNDIGDVSMYGKFKYKVADHWNIGGGLDLSLPTGPERKYSGTGELGVNPFVSTRYEWKRLAVGGHLGYQFYTGEVKNVLNYSAHFIVKLASTVAFRTELSGRNFKQFGETFDDVLVLPGIDIDFFDALTIRPTGMLNLTPESQDWGVGVGFATRFNLL